MDLDTLHQDILSALSSDPIVTKHISTDGQWSTDPNSLLLLNNRIYVPSCYDSKLKGLSNELTLVLSDTRELDRVPSTE